MKHFKIFVWKEFLHIWRDKKTLMIIILLPIIEVLLFGYVLTNEINNVSIGIKDLDQSKWSHDLLSRFESSSYFEPLYFRTQPEVEKAMLSNRIMAVIEIKPDAERRLHNGEKGVIQLLLDASDPNMARTIEVYVTSILKRGLGSWSKSPLKVTQRMYYNPELKSVYKSIPGLIAVVLMLICAMMTSVSLTREKETGSMDILLISPLKTWHIVIGKMIPYIVISFVNIIMILALATGVFGVPVEGSYIMLLLISGLYVVCALSFGLFVSTIVETQQIAMMISLAGLMLPTTLLSGLIYPIRNMPQWLQIFSGLFPARWFIDILSHIMLKNSPVNYYIISLAMLLIITSILLTAASKRFKVQYD